MATNFKAVDGLLSKAKINLMTRQDSVFITTVLFSLNPKWDTTIPTAATNGVDLIINPHFFEQLDFPERVFVLAHETWHVIFQHMDRQMGRDPVKWNHACDYVINLMLKDNGFKVMRGALIDEQYRDMSAAEIYDVLPDPQGDPGGTGSDLQDAPKNMTKDEFKQHVEGMVQRASMAADRAGQSGTIPGDVQRWLNKLTRTKVDWRKQLRNFFTALAKKDFSLSKPNRRYVANGFYLPTLQGEAMGEIACAVDESGSVSDEEFTAFVSEMKAIFEIYMPEKMTILGFDTQINTIKEIKPGEAFNPEFKGYGGTDMWPVFEYFKGKKPPKCLIVFSDMYCDMSMPKPPFPVIWVCVNREGWNHDWGKVIHYDTTDLFDR